MGTAVTVVLADAKLVSRGVTFPPPLFVLASVARGRAGKHRASVRYHWSFRELKSACRRNSLLEGDVARFPGVHK